MHITLYTQPNCQPCKATARKLDAMGLDYDTVDVSVNPEAVEMLKTNFGVQQTPVVVATDGNALVAHFAGYRPDLIKALAHRSGIGVA